MSIERWSQTIFLMHLEFWKIWWIWLQQVWRTELNEVSQYSEEYTVTDIFGTDLSFTDFLVAIDLHKFADDNER